MTQYTAGLTLTDRLALFAVGGMLAAPSVSNLNMRGAVALEAIENDLGCDGPAAALTIARHAGSASRVRDLELADLRADRLAVSR